MDDAPVNQPWTVTDYLLASILDELRASRYAGDSPLPARSRVKRPSQAPVIGVNIESRGGKGVALAQAVADRITAEEMLKSHEIGIR